MIPRKTCHSFAPSTRAASSSSALMPLSAADRMTIAKPVHIQVIDDDQQDRVEGQRARSAATGPGRRPKAASDAVEGPGLRRPGGSYAYMNRQITPAATMLMASGRKMTDLATDLVADPVDEDARSSRPSPTVNSGQQDDPEDVVAERDRGCRRWLKNHS